MKRIDDSIYRESVTPETLREWAAMLKEEEIKKPSDKVVSHAEYKMLCKEADEILKRMNNEKK